MKIELRKIKSKKESKGLGIIQKKGIFALLLIVAILTITAIFGLLSYRMIKGVNEVYNDSGLFPDGSIGQESNQAIKTTAKYGIDNMFFFVFLGSVIGLIFGAVKTRFSPILMFIFILVFLFAIFLASMSAEIYHGFATNGELEDTANEFIFIKIILSKFFPLIICVIGAVVMIIMWSKQGGEIVR